MNGYLLFKSLHIVFIVSWFAGLFYLVRLFIYAREAQNKPEPEKSILTEQFLFMQSKLLKIITLPAMVFSLFFGIGMLFYVPQFLMQPWMIAKFIGIFFLLIYQWYTYKIHLYQKHKNFRHSSIFLRFYNELATILLIAIVMLAVFKTSTDFIRYFIVVFFFVVLIVTFIILYNKKRK